MPPDMLLKDRVDDQIVIARHRQQTIHRTVRPIHGQAHCEGDEPVVEGILFPVEDDFVAHERPGKVVYPCWMWDEELSRGRVHPLGHALVVLLCGIEEPAGCDELDPDYGYAIGDGVDVGKAGCDIGHGLGEGVNALAGIEERHD